MNNDHEVRLPIDVRYIKKFLEFDIPTISVDQYNDGDQILYINHKKHNWEIVDKI